MNEGKMKISSPWVSYVHKLRALFGKDPDIEIFFDDADNVVTLHVKSDAKAKALERILKPFVTFGKNVLKITVVSDNAEENRKELFIEAFRDNPLFSGVTKITPEGSSYAFTYVMFKNQTVQYWDDNFGDPHGNVTTLAQDLMWSVIETDDDLTNGVYFCTEPEPFEV